MNHPLHQFIYCPKCGANTFIERNEKAKQCTTCGFVYYFNPSSAVACFIRNAAGEILLVRRAKEPAKGTLDLPGGFVDMFESAEDAAHREVKEETGLDKLEDAIKELFFSGNLELNEDIYIANQRQKQLLIEAKEAFLLVKDGIESGMSEDFLTIDLMTAYEKLGYIIGEEVEDDLADKIFKSFCMGK